MAIEHAKKLLAELQADETKLEAFLKAPADFLAKNYYDCTESEVKEAYAMNREMDDEELLSLTGGSGCSVIIKSGAKGPGHCAENYYDEKCAATVETGSWCGSNDFCETWDVVYHCYGPAEG